MSKAVIYLLYDTDIRQKNGKLRCASTSPTGIKQAVDRAIRAGDMSYSYGEEEKETQQLKMFHRDWKTIARNDINSHLAYGFLDITHSGEDI